MDDATSKMGLVRMLVTLIERMDLVRIACPAADRPQVVVAWIEEEFLGVALQLGILGSFEREVPSPRGDPSS